MNLQERNNDSTDISIRAAGGRPADQNDEQRHQHGNGSNGGITAMQCGRVWRGYFLAGRHCLWEAGNDRQDLVSVESNVQLNQWPGSEHLGQAHYHLVMGVIILLPTQKKESTDYFYTSKNIIRYRAC